MKSLQIGIIGCGSFIIRRILPAISALNSIKVVHIQKRDKQKAHEVATQFMIPRYSSTKEELLQDPEVNFVIIGSQNHMHEEAALCAANHKKPTLCEKPLSLTYESTLKMVKAFDEKETPFFVGHSLRFKPAVIKAKELIKEGVIGKLLNIRPYFSIPVDASNWRRNEKGGGALFDLGVHLIDLVRYISEDEISTVKAVDTSFKNIDLTINAIGALKQGALFSFECSFLQTLKSGFEIVGTHGRIISENSLRQLDSNQMVEKFMWTDKDDTLHHVELPFKNIYEEEMKHLQDVLLRFKPTVISATEGLKNQQVIDSIFQDLKKSF